MSVWFGEIDLDGAPSAARQVFDHLSQLLAELNPHNLDPTQQSAAVDRGEIAVHLVHRQDCDADLHLAIGEGTTHFYGIFGHDEAYGPDWRAETLEIAREILVSNYGVETQLRRGRPYRTLIRGFGAHEGRFMQLDSVLGIFPRSLSAVETSYREFTYDCRGNPEMSGGDEKAIAEDDIHHHRFDL